MFNSGIKCTGTTRVVITNPGYFFWSLFVFKGGPRVHPLMRKQDKKVCFGKQIGSVKRVKCQRNETERIKFEIR